LQAKTDKVKKRYKVNVKRKRKFDIEGEQDLVSDMVVILKLANYTNTQIAMICGISRGQVKIFLEDGNVRKKYLALKEKLPQAALDLGRQYLIEAVQAVAHVMRTSTDDAIVLKAAGELFDRFGIPKSSKIETTPDPSEGDGDPMSDPSLMVKLRKASPEVQQGVADLHEMFMSGVEQLLGKQEETSDEPT